MKVNYISELPDYENYDSFRAYIAVGEDKDHIRTMRIDQLKSLREANRVPEQETDADFLFGDPQFRSFINVIRAAEGSGPQILFELCNMAEDKKEGKKQGQKLEFPADAFAGGTKKAQ